MKVYVVMGIGCLECGLGSESEVLGVYRTLDAAEAAHSEDLAKHRLGTDWMVLIREGELA